PEPYTAAGATLMGTWPHGAVTVRCSRSGMIVETYRSGQRLLIPEHAARASGERPHLLARRAQGLLFLEEDFAHLRVRRGVGVEEFPSPFFAEGLIVLKEGDALAGQLHRGCLRQLHFHQRPLASRREAKGWLAHDLGFQHIRSDAVIAETQLPRFVA